jgi:hypothetical protein
MRIPSKVLGSICIAEGKVAPHDGHTRVRSGRVVVSIPSLSACCRRARWLESVRGSWCGLQRLSLHDAERH